MTTEAQCLPNRLIVEAGILKMKDGSDVVEYLKTRKYLDGHDIVILRREDALRLIDGYSKTQSWHRLRGPDPNKPISITTSVLLPGKLNTVDFSEKDWYRFWLAS